MKKGISIWSFVESDIRKCFEIAKDAGFDGVEVALDAQGAITMDSTKEDVLKVKKIAEEVGIEFYSVASGLYWTYNYKNRHSLDTLQFTLPLSLKSLHFL